MSVALTFDCLVDLGTSKEQSDERSEELALQLKTGLVSKRKLMRQASIPRWANELYELMCCGFSFEEVKETIDWYIMHIDDDYVPAAYSAKTFRDKYPNIEQAMRRYNGKRERVVEDRFKKLAMESM